MNYHDSERLSGLLEAEGYEVISNMLYKALLEGFAAHLRTQGRR